MTVMLSDMPALKKQTTRLWKRDELPQGLKWLEQLSPLHYRLCLIELHAATSQACLTDDDWERVAELLEDWQATAELDAQPELANRILSDDLEYEDLDLAELKI